MIDIVIPLRTELLPTVYTELKYALRSIEKHLTGKGRIFIIGVCPTWLNLQHADYIPFEEKDWFRGLTRNIHNKLKLACTLPQISENFLYFNDDHFLLQDIDANPFPYFHNGPEFGGKGQYRKATIPDTLAMLKEKRKDVVSPNNYDTHTPILINKQMYLDTVGTLNWKKDFGYCIKTSYVYLARWNHGGQYCPDLKIHDVPSNMEVLTQLLHNEAIFSTGTKAFKMLYNSSGEAIGNPIMTFLESRFPEKSIYEI